MAGHRNHPRAAAGEGQGRPAGPPSGDGERVAKALARAGVASRREIERLIAAGRVALNGAILTSPAVKVGGRDILTVDGAVVAAAEPTRLFRYHKPAGLVTTHSDPKGRRTVFDVLPPGLPRLISVGRLDLTSEGLLLLTNDGELARALELPSSGWPRRYRARARGRIAQARLDKLADGITVEGVRYGAIEARLDPARAGAPSANLWLTLTLAEGKNREVRRVLEALGLTVNRLIRIGYGPFALGELAAGRVEEVAPALVRQHLSGAIAAANLPRGDRTQFKPYSAPRPRPARAPAKPASRTAGEAPPAKKGYQPGWARPKPRSGLTNPGSRPAASPSAGPRARTPTSSPRQSSRARRPGPPPRDGRGPDG